MVDVVVVGQLGLDLVLAVDRLPEAGASVPVTERREVFGGGVNQAVGCRQLGCSTAAVGVVGADDAGARVVEQMRQDGIGVTGVVRRPTGRTALLVDVVEADGTHRLLEHVPDEALLTAPDVRAADAVLGAARAVLVQLQQPAGAVLEATRTAALSGALVLVDGFVDEPEVLDAVLGAATVVRADASEAPRLVGRPLEEVADVVDAAQELVAAGPAVVALAAGRDGNVVAWRGGYLVLPLLGGPPVDPTGGGDAFVAGLVTALLRGHDAATAGRWGSAAAALTVARLGGRPALDEREVADLARGADGPGGGAPTG